MGSVGWSDDPAVRAAEQAEFADGLHFKIDGERCYIFASSGSRLLGKDSRTSEIVFSQPGLDRVRAAGHAVLTHNHPRGTSFSGADIDLALTCRLREIRAVGTNFENLTFVYRLRLPPDAWQYREAALAVVSRYRTVLEGAFDDLVQRREVTVEYAKAYFAHELWKVVCLTLGFWYERRSIE